MSATLLIKQMTSVEICLSGFGGQSRTLNVEERFLIISPVLCSDSDPCIVHFC